MAKTKNFYASSRREISMRDEMINTISGTLSEIAKAQIGVLRVMRRDDDNELIECVCRDEASNEPMKSPIVCPTCHGCGYYWDEQFIKFYKLEPGYDTALAMKEMGIGPGDVNIPLRVFYLPYDQSVSEPKFPDIEQLTIFDKVIELVLDSEGDPVVPYRRRAIYEIATIYDYRLDEGRLEYWKILGTEDKTLKLNVT